MVSTAYDAFEKTGIETQLFVYDKIFRNADGDDEASGITRTAPLTLSLIAGPIMGIDLRKKIYNEFL